MMASGRLWQIVLWRGARPGILLQMMLAPRATTVDSPLRWKRHHQNMFSDIIEKEMNGREGGAQAYWLTKTILCEKSIDPIQ